MAGSKLATEGFKVLVNPRTGEPITHGGSGTSYEHFGCRCFECREANSKRAHRRRKERKSEKKPVHGKASTYINWECRCYKCKAAHNEKVKAYNRSLKNVA